MSEDADVMGERILDFMEQITQFTLEQWIGILSPMRSSDKSGEHAAPHKIRKAIWGPVYDELWQTPAWQYFVSSAAHVGRASAIDAGAKLGQDAQASSDQDPPWGVKWMARGTGWHVYEFAQSDAEEIAMMSAGAIIARERIGEAKFAALTRPMREAGINFDTLRSEAE